MNRREKSGCGYTVLMNALVVAMCSGAGVITTFRMQIEIKAITDVLQWLRQEKYSQLVTDSKTTERVPLCRLDGHYTQIEQTT